MKKVHFLGIGGSGASAVAKIAESQGFEVTGCDLYPDNEFTTQFNNSQLLTGHDPKHLFCHPEHSTCHPERSEGSTTNLDSSLITQNDKLIDILAVTPAIYSLDPENPELLEAKKMGIEILTWQEFMGKYLEKDQFVIAVCGTHGKSTTTAMIGLLLEDAGLDPTVELGAIVPKWGTNYRIGKSKPVLSGAEGYFVTEADEFNDNFLATHPDISVVTTIEMDHPEYFKDFENYKKSFTKFLNQTKKTIIANSNDDGVYQVLNNILRSEVVTATESRSFVSSSRLRSNNKISVIDYSKKLINFPLQIPGKHNVLNASGVFQVGIALGIKPEVIQKSLENFTGIGRRFEKIGNFKGTEVYSDFAHHPTEIKATIEAAKEKFPNKNLVVVFQPHMFSRTKALFDDFVKVFQEIQVKQIYILDIFPSREIDTGIINSKQLVEAINQKTSVQAQYVPFDTILKKVKTNILPNEVLFFMGAGDTDKLAKKLLKD